MISLETFYDNLKKIQPFPDQEQKMIIEADKRENLFVVAGPGSGKTNVLTTRILKLIFVDGIPPKAILATTFTKKAATELRSRILGRGFQLIDCLQDENSLKKGVIDFINEVDINQITTGTIDSICDLLLRDYREPGTIPRQLIDEFVSSTIMLREGLFTERRFQRKELEDFIIGLQGTSWGLNIGRKVATLREIWDRRFQDQINWDTFVKDKEKDFYEVRPLFNDIFQSYKDYLDERKMLDFTLLEQFFLERIRSGALKDFFEGLEVVLVDEYQDTNLLQERIYFEIKKQSGSSLVVVGDDDQSLYRFRGATVDLFINFPKRFFNNFNSLPRKNFLKTNYRSTEKIIGFVNKFIKMDMGYQKVRVSEKPEILPGKKLSGVPILCMFRENLEKLAESLGEFIFDVFEGDGHELPDGSLIIKDPDGGNLGDCSLLSYSPLERKFNGDFRLPGLLRNKLEEKTPKIEIFNPRGQEITEIRIIRLFGGLLLESLDPGGIVQGSTRGIREVEEKLVDWRETAKEFIKSDECSQELKRFFKGWQKRDPQKDGYDWPREVPFLELVYSLIHWFPFLHNNPEGQIYVELFTRQLTACELIGRWGGKVIHSKESPTLSNKSVEELIRNVFVPIASGGVKVNEELVDVFPRDKLSVLSIHQAKGLEFPLTIVDVGSEFKSNHHTQAFKRFPREGDKTHKMEDEMRPYSPLGIDKRTAKDRAFDDLFRRFFVAYSRAQNVLLLVGTDKCRPGGKVKTITTGWDREGKNKWPNFDYIEI